MLLVYKRMYNNFETLKLLLNNINRLYDLKKKRSAFTISSVVPAAGAGCLQPCSILLHDDAVYWSKHTCSKTQELEMPFVNQRSTYRWTWTAYPACWAEWGTAPPRWWSTGSLCRACRSFLLLPFLRTAQDQTMFYRSYQHLENVS